MSRSAAFTPLHLPHDNTSRNLSHSRQSERWSDLKVALRRESKRDRLTRSRSLGPAGPLASPDSFRRWAISLPLNRPAAFAFGKSFSPLPKWLKSNPPAPGWSEPDGRGMSRSAAFTPLHLTPANARTIFQRPRWFARWSGLKPALPSRPERGIYAAAPCARQHALKYPDAVVNPHAEATW